MRSGIGIFVMCGALVTVGATELATDFQLLDVNPNSVRHGAPVSPRDYILQVSGYYFATAG
jgi:hypothetical protein